MFELWRAVRLQYTTELTACQVTGGRLKTLTSCRTSSRWTSSERGWSRSAPTDCASSAGCPCPSGRPSVCGLSCPVSPPAGPETECPERPSTAAERRVNQRGGWHEMKYQMCVCVAGNVSMSVIVLFYLKLSVYSCQLFNEELLT